MAEIKLYECDCDRCSSMCHAPCCGTPEDIKRLIENGYASRLMLDDLPGGADMIKPALKGYEGKESPWEVASRAGCTFWKEGKCELHSLGLKPLQGKASHHDLDDEEIEKIGEYINSTWQKDGETVISLWKKQTFLSL